MFNYTYSVIIKALAADPDPKFLEVAKECILEMMEKGWQPNTKTYTAVFKAFALQEKGEEGKQFREEMEAKGFVADKMDVTEVLKGTTGPVVKSIHNILFGKEISCSFDFLCVRLVAEVKILKSNGNVFDVIDSFFGVVWDCGYEF